MFVSSSAVLLCRSLQAAPLQSGAFGDNLVGSKSILAKLALDGRNQSLYVLENSSSGGNKHENLCA
jgi:hypothetical protein